MGKEQYRQEMNSITVGDALRSRLLDILENPAPAQAGPQNGPGEKPAGARPGLFQGRKKIFWRRALPLACCLALAAMLVPFALSRGMGMKMGSADAAPENVQQSLRDEAADGAPGLTTQEMAGAAAGNVLEIVYMPAGELPGTPYILDEKAQAPACGAQELLSPAQAALALARGEYVSRSPAPPEGAVPAAYEVLYPERGDGAAVYRFYVALPDYDPEDGTAAFGVYDVAAG